MFTLKSRMNLMIDKIVEWILLLIIILIGVPTIGMLIIGLWSMLLGELGIIWGAC